MALRVCRSWLAAAKSMASLGFAVANPSAPLDVVARSAMGRHIARLRFASPHPPLTWHCLALLARHMPQLRELHCEMKLAPMAPVHVRLAFPPGLLQLDLQLLHSPISSSMADVNRVVKAVGRLSLLQSLVLRLPILDDRLSFAPLASMPQLRDLDIHLPLGAPDLSDAQVDQLRSMPNLRRLWVMSMTTPLLRRLLAQPHQLQWQSMTLPSPLDDEAAALLPQLLSLTALSAWPSCTHFDFLRRLPNLVDVNFLFHQPPEEADADAAGRMELLVAGLQCCSRIETLSLDNCADLHAAHLVELLPRLPRLRELWLLNLAVDSLAFLAQEPVPTSLRLLALIGCSQLPLTEMRHVHALRNLTQLTVIHSFSTPMDAHCQSLYTPPSQLLPHLDKFDYTSP
jgi:hypothetical protein